MKGSPSKVTCLRWTPLHPLRCIYSFLYGQIVTPSDCPLYRVMLCPNLLGWPSEQRGRAKAMLELEPEPHYTGQAVGRLFPS